MKLYIVENYDELSKKAAEVIAEEIKIKNDIVLGLATGSTPEGMYAELVKMHDNGEIDFSNASTFNLDEYYGLDDEHEQSYHYFMNKHLLKKINIDSKKTNIPSGCTDDVEKVCKEYDEKIEASGGIDLQLLGIGMNGHIGFNEPGNYFVGETHIVNLTEDTLDANARFFETLDDVPKKAITMGMKSILNSKKILLIASGSGKADAMYMALRGPITPKVPASILQLHQNLIVIVDNEAGAKL